MSTEVLLASTPLPPCGSSKALYVVHDCCRLCFAATVALGVQAPAADVFLVFGSTGWIGGMMCDLLEKQGKTFVRAASRIENREDTAR